MSYAPYQCGSTNETQTNSQRESLRVEQTGNFKLGKFRCHCFFCYTDTDQMTTEYFYSVPLRDNFCFGPHCFYVSTLKMARAQAGVYVICPLRVGRAYNFYAPSISNESKPHFSCFATERHIFRCGSFLFQPSHKFFFKKVAYNKILITYNSK